MYGLDDDVINILVNYFEQTKQIEKVIIFGSRACGNYKESSDIDFALVGDINNYLLFKITDDLSSLPLIYKFDVLNYKDISNKKLLAEIRTKGKIFYERQIKNQ